MNDHSIDRRAFLHTTFVAVAAAIFFPSGAVVARGSSDEILRLNVEVFPELDEMHRSVRIMVDAIGHGLLLTRTGASTYVAVSDLCTHQGCSIDDLDAKTLTYTCPCHGSRYDVVGNVIAGPAEAPLERYDAVREGDTIIVRTGTSGVDAEGAVVRLDAVGFADGRVDVAFDLDRAAGVRFLLYTIDGREALRIDGGWSGPGERRLAADARDLLPGGYVGVLEIDGRPRMARKLLVP